MRKLIIGLILIFTLILQSTILRFLSIHNVVPNITIIIVISFALIRGSKEGATIGFFAGLLYDLTFGGAIGAYALLNMFLGYFTGMVTTTFYRESYILPLLTATGAVFIYEHLQYVLLYLFQGNTQYVYFLENIILPELIYTAILVPLCYRLVWEINHKLERFEEKKY